jgi:peptide/nickel transport system ATP-binding protein
VSERGVLAARDITVELQGDAGLVRAVDCLRLTLARGETFALVGESGCGKSMTALALMRLLPANGRIAAGEVRLGDIDLLSLAEADMRAIRGGQLGMIFQEPATSLNPVMRVGEQIVEAIHAHTPLRGAAARAKAIDWLRRVGIPEPERRIDEYPFRLSGGQKQRVMIAMTLAAEPDFLIADEPTTALDVTIQAQILELLKDLQRERGLGMLLITHDLAVVSGIAHTVALMYAGQIVELASAARFFRAPRHPYARLLLAALPEAGKRNVRLAAIAGSVPSLAQRFDACRFAPRCDLTIEVCRRIPPALDGTDDPAHDARCHRWRESAALLERRPVDERVSGAGVRVRPGAPPAGSSTIEATASGASALDGGWSAPGVPLLEVEGLRVRFPIRRGLLQRVRGAFTAVDGVSFAMRSGTTLALVGESGCGKTTLGKAIVQLLRGQALVEGAIRLEGRDLLSLRRASLQQARRSVQMIFQDPFASLNPRMRVADILEEGLVALHPGLDAAARRARIEAMTERVGLRADALERFPHEFSGGQRQRIAIARALAVQPRLLVCDEPTSALDVSVQAQILNLLRELQREFGMAYLFITHNIGVVEYVADDVAVMRRGRIEEMGPAGAVLYRARHEYTRSLLAAVPRLAPAA